MPYNPSGVYTLPAIYLAVPGTTIIAAQHNDPLVDLQDAQNYERPIIGGGTGAGTPSGARSSLAVPGLATGNTFAEDQTFSKRVLASDGSQALPSVAFNNDPDTGISSGGANKIRFSTGGTTKVKIAATGSLQIGNEAYDGTVINDVGINLAGVGAGTPGSMSATASGFASLFQNRIGSNGNITEYYRQGVFAGNVSVTTAPATTYNSASDYRLKKNPYEITDFWSRIEGVIPRGFTWNGGEPGKGFFAHEFAEHYPASVTGEKDAVDDNGDPVFQTMQAATSEVLADIFMALKDIQTRLRALEISSRG